MSGVYFFGSVLGVAATGVGPEAWECYLFEGPLLEQELVARVEEKQTEGSVGSAGLMLRSQVAVELAHSAHNVVLVVHQRE